MTDPKWWDFTVSMKEMQEKGLSAQAFEQRLDDLADRWAYGEETGDGGYRHLQGRVVFKAGKELATIRNQVGIGHWTPTHVRDFKYVEKDGKFVRSWEKVLRRFANIELLPWQKQVEEYLKVQNDRQVLVVYDPVGNTGKTTLAKYLTVTHQAQYVPPMGDAQDLMAFALEKEAPGYVFDLPRAESDKVRKGMWSAIEQVKNGYVYDKRYSYRDAWREPARVVVFCNELPDETCLSEDRWMITHIEDFGGEKVLFGGAC